MSSKVKALAGEMAQWLRVLTALPEVLRSILSNHMVAHNHLKWDPMLSSGVSEENDSVLTYIREIFNKRKKVETFLTILNHMSKFF